MTSRRAFLIGLGAAIAAPAVIRTPGLLMPVHEIIVPKTLTWPTLVEIASRINMDGQIARIAEMMSATNDLFTDIGWVEV